MLPGYEARAPFTVNSAAVFREEVDIVPTIVDADISYIPWGGDNLMPFIIIDLNAVVCFGSGLQYDCSQASAAVKSQVEDFLLDNDLASYFFGVCQDFKHFGLAVSVLLLSEGGKIMACRSLFEGLAR